LSRNLLVAGVVASVLHLAVLASIGLRSSSGVRDSVALQPLMISFADFEPDEAPAPPIESANPLNREVTPPPIVDEESGEILHTEADGSVAPPPSEATEAVDATSEEGVEAGLPDPTARIPAPVGISETVETIPDDAAPTIDAKTGDTAEVDDGIILPARPIVHRLVSAPPLMLMAMLTSVLQRAASPPVKPRPSEVASTGAALQGERIAPVLEHRPKPIYPTVARRRGYEGTVVLRIEVLEDGSVGGVEIHQSSGHDVLDRQAERTIREQWRFRPGRLDGRAAALWIDIPIEFHLVDS